MSKKRSKARRNPPPAARPPVMAVNAAVAASTDDADSAGATGSQPVAEMAVDMQAEAAAPTDASLSDASVDAVTDTADTRQAAVATVDAPDGTVEAAGAAESRPAPPTVADLQLEAARFAPFDDPGAIRGVLIQVAGGRLLLPNATIAEVLSYAEPEPVGGDAPEWLLGRMRWRGWQLPLVAFSQLAGVGTERAGLGTKVVVLKALGTAGKTPYFAILTQGFPRLVTVSTDALAQDADSSELPRGVLAHVRLNQDAALLPDLESIESLIADALAQAA